MQCSFFGDIWMQNVESSFLQIHEAMMTEPCDQLAHEELTYLSLIWNTDDAISVMPRSEERILFRINKGCVHQI